MLIEEETVLKSTVETQRFLYTFVKRDRTRIDAQTSIMVGSRVAMSLQDPTNPRYCLGFGWVKLVTQRKIIIATSNELSTPEDVGAISSQRFAR